MIRKKLAFTFLATIAVFVNTIFVLKVNIRYQEPLEMLAILNVSNSSEQISNELPKTITDHSFQHMTNKTVELKSQSFNFILNPKEAICGSSHGKDLLFIAFIPISPENFQQRMIIRNSWSNPDYFSNIKAVFLTGLSRSNEINEKLQHEFELFGDIVQENFMDTYKNLTLKTLMGFKWVSKYCSNAKFILKVDDDVVVNTVFLANYLNAELLNNETTYNTIRCFYYEKAHVFRNKDSKFYLSKEEFEPDYFQPYCDGPAYLLTTDLAEKFYNESANVKLFQFEDVYVGMLAAKLNSKFINIEEQYALNTIASSFNASLAYDKLSFIYLKKRKDFINIWLSLFKIILISFL